ncbi:MAG: UDP-N-acetylmuramoyl-L-alanine--D-glutamate ligase [Sphingomonadales bacterium]|nr:UDP-N-acetylmuramoyl-L-alanine--D-glutamate ligase [Sphingomonadales bacterium]
MKKEILVLGGGESGVGAAMLAVAKGIRVRVSDSGPVRDSFGEELNDLGIPWEAGGHNTGRWGQISTVVKSPGIPDDAAVVLELRKKGIPVISEIEFAAQHTLARLIGITGTNGKTTTTLLTADIFRRAGWNMAYAGNVGNSFARSVAEAGQDRDVYILEISSFQLDGMYNTRLDVGVITNITPDHLDRYQYRMENYVQSKLRIARNMRSTETLIYCTDDATTCAALSEADSSIGARRMGFGTQRVPGSGAWIENNHIVLHNPKEDMYIPIDDLSLKGKHNTLNAMAAALPARLFDIRNEIIRDSLSRFEAIEHRLEPVATIKGVDYINDSKATNVNSVWFALESISKPIVWIAGGTDKGNDYSVLVNLVPGRVKALICMGLDNRLLHDAFSDVVPVMVNTSSMEESVRMAYHLAEKGDVVLLSPACASFDLFQNYEDRGRQFKKYVKML